MAFAEGQVLLQVRHCRRLETYLKEFILFETKKSQHNLLKLPRGDLSHCTLYAVGTLGADRG